MTIIKKSSYLKQLQKILRFIALDKPSAALNFERELNRKFSILRSYPKQCRKSHYINDERYRDMIHKGYTIIYRIDGDALYILDIFKWQDC